MYAVCGGVNEDLLAVEYDARTLQILDETAETVRDADINVAYDVDDVLNNLNQYVFEKLQLPEPDSYRIMESNMYTDSEKAAIFGLYGEADTFKHLKYSPLCSKLCDIEKVPGVYLWINSVSFSHEIADIKRATLAESIPGLNSDRVVMQITTDASDKKELRDCTVMVEDNLLNLIKHTETPVKILIDKPYNQAATYGTTDEECGVIRVKDLSIANSLIYRLLMLARPGVRVKTNI